MQLASTRSIAGLLALFAAAPASADLLVTPVRAYAAHGNIGIGPVEPSGRSHTDEFTHPRGAVSSNFSRSSQAGNERGNGSGYGVTFFFEFPVGEVNKLEIAGHGEGDVLVSGHDPRPLAASGYSSVELRFEVTEAVAYDLTGLLDMDVSSSGAGEGVATLNIELLNSPFNVIHRYRHQSFENLIQPIGVTGVLQPGTYVLAAWASVSVSSDTPGAHWTAESNFNATMEFMPVPAPGAAALGLPLLIGAMRRRR